SIFGHPPLPVAADGGWYIEPCFIPRPEQVLHGNDGKVRMRGKHTSDTPVSRPFLFCQVQLRRRFFVCLPSSGFKPAPHRLCIMVSGIGYSVPGIIVRQIFRIFCRVKTELQYFHTRVSRILNQFIYFISQEPEVFSHDIPLAKCILHSVEQVHARTFHPVAVFGRRVPCWNLPVRLKSPEVVDSDRIIQIKAFLYPSDPPSVAVTRHRIPVIYGISPQLARG